jgi:hypothetical protein
MLRELAEMIDFAIARDGDTGIIGIDTAKTYSR